MPRWRTGLIPFVLALFVTVPLPTLAADEKPVELEVWTIRATTKNSDISPELKELAESLKKQFKFTGFKLEKKSPGKAELSKAFSTDLIGGYKATVTPTKREGDKKISLKITVTKGKNKEEKTIYNSTLTIETGKFQAVGGWQMDDKDTLVIAVRAR